MAQPFCPITLELRIKKSDQIQPVTTKIPQYTIWASGWWQCTNGRGKKEVTKPYYVNINKT